MINWKLAVMAKYVSETHTSTVRLDDSGVLSLETKSRLKPRYLRNLDERLRDFEERLAAFNVSEPHCLKYMGIYSLYPEGV